MKKKFFKLIYVAFLAFSVSYLIKDVHDFFVMDPLVEKFNIAMKKNNSKEVRALLRSQKNPKKIQNAFLSIYHETPLMRACFRGRDFKVVKVLVEEGAEVNFADSHGFTALYFAVEKERTEIVNYLLKNGAKADIHRTFADEKRSWAHYTSAKARAKAEKEKIFTDKKSYLHLAATKGNLEILKAIIDAGADVNHQDTRQETALHESARKGCFECVQLLKQKGADVNLVNNRGETALSLLKKTQN